MSDPAEGGFKVQVQHFRKEEMFAYEQEVSTP